MSADEVVRALEQLRDRVDDLRSDVGSTKSRVETARRRVGSLAQGANGQGNVGLLRSSRDQFRIAVDQIDVCHDALKAAVESIQRYGSTRFNWSAGGAGGGGQWVPSGTATDHVDRQDRKQRRSAVKHALVIGVTGGVAAVGVGTLLGALAAGAPLAVAVGVSMVPNTLAFAISRARDYLEFRELVARGATRSELRQKTKEVLAASAADGAGFIPVVGNAIGAVTNMKSFVEDILALKKILDEQ